MHAMQKSPPWSAIVHGGLFYITSLTLCEIAGGGILSLKQAELKHPANEITIAVQVALTNANTRTHRVCCPSQCSKHPSLSRVRYARQ